MSRIGKKPISIPKGVTVEYKGRTLKVSGPNGTLQLDCPAEIELKVENGSVVLTNPQSEERFSRAMHGTTRALISNMVQGTLDGFKKRIQIFGTGYNVKEQGGKIVISVGFCQPAQLPIPKGVKVEIKTPATKGNDIPAEFAVSGPDKQKVGQFAAEIRKIRPPEPYQGKGIRYADEVVKRKEGKAFASGG